MERQAFMDAVTRHQDMVYRIALHWFGVPQDAEDAVQEVFLRLYTEKKPFDGPEHLRRWLIRVTVNVCKDALKSPWRKRTCGLDACMEVPAPEAEDGSVLAAVNQLPAHYRAVIYLFYYEGYDAREIGQILGIPTATVHTRLARGRAKLKEILGGYGYEQTV